ncbi:hypothetical protein WJX81_006730 [Elliptochloris bilobata]|uniref:Ketoreductase domain-containing protein n=1 Tax=Elliptochloris bilobata TaxID=381761 RepID=A0AAW1S5L3_9CHLO
MLVAGVAQRLLGKVAIVTGAARGIGLACASCLGHEGCKVVIADVDDDASAKAVQQLQLEGVIASAAHCDVTSKHEVEELVSHAVQQYGGVDIMVANAGIVKGADFLEMSEADFDAVINVNLKGVFLCGQIAAQQMVEQNRHTPGRGGAVINMSSVNAVMAIPSIAGYNASKGGVNNLTRCMALSLAPHNIRVNAIGPGSIMTPVLAAVANDRAAMNRVLSRTPMGRVGDPFEIGQIASFLASDAASYITGQVLYADGGRMALNYVVPAIKDEVEARQSARRSGGAHQALRDRLQQLRGDWNAELAKKQGIRAQLEDASASRSKLASEVKGMKSSIQYTTPAQIDELIVRLEDRQRHGNLSTAEERRTLAEIEKAKTSRKALGEYAARMEKLSSNDAAHTSIRDDLRACDARLAAIKEQEEKARAELAALREGDSESSNGLGELFKERDLLRDTNKEIYEKICEMRAAYKAENDKYWEEEKAFRDWYREDKKRKNDKFLAEKAERDAQRKAIMRETAGEPYNKEVAMCEQLAVYLAKFKAPVAVTAAAASSAAAPAAPPEGYKVFKKSDVEDDNILSLSSGVKRGGKKARGRAGERKDDKPAEAKLVHTMDMLGAFSALRVEVPLTTSRVPVALEALEARRQHYLAKRAQAKESGEDVVEEANGRPAQNGHAKPRSQKPLELGNADTVVVRISATGDAEVPVAVQLLCQDNEFPAL